jgi:hypothetical protein
MKPESARLYIRRWDNGALSIHEEPTEGAFPYDCVECLDTTGHQCLDHHEPECTCYELHGAHGGHQPGCRFHGKSPADYAASATLPPFEIPDNSVSPEVARAVAEASPSMAQRCTVCGWSFGAHIVTKGGPLQCPNGEGIFA